MAASRRSRGWESGEEPLLARFTVDVPRFALPAGKRLLLPANLFHSTQMEAFTSADRKFPVYFPYTYEEIDNVTIELPEGYEATALPNGQDVKSTSTRFIITRSSKSNHLLLTRALVVNSIYFPPDQYSPLKSFFEKLQTADEEQIVIEESAPTSR